MRELFLVLKIERIREGGDKYKCIYSHQRGQSQVDLDVKLIQPEDVYGLLLSDCNICWLEKYGIVAVALLPVPLLHCKR